MKKNIPKVAVLLAAFNGEPYIKEQVKSILNQKNVYIDLYISVDLSDDSTFILCEQLKDENSQIKLLPYGKKFGSAAKNFFWLICKVNLEKYEYISFSDQDDIWLRTKLSYAVNKIVNKNVEAFSSDVIAFNANGNEILIKKSYPQKKFDHFFESAGPGCTYVVKAKALQKFKNTLMINYNHFQSVALHDWMIYAYFRAHNMTWHIDPKPLIKYRIHAYNHIGPNLGISALIKRYHMIKSGWYINQVRIISTIAQNTKISSFKLEIIFLLKNFFQLRRSSLDAFILLLFILMSIFKA